MEVEWVRKYCLSLPHTTETVQWGNSLLFKIGGKMYAVTALEPGPHWLSFKCSIEMFGELIERPGIVPAPYLTRAQWVALQTGTAAVRRDELKELLRSAYDLIFSKLSLKVRSSCSA